MRFSGGFMVGFSCSWLNIIGPWTFKILKERVYCQLLISALFMSSKSKTSYQKHRHVFDVFLCFVWAVNIFLRSESNTKSPSGNIIFNFKYNFGETEKLFSLRRFPFLVFARELLRCLLLVFQTFERLSSMVIENTKDPSTQRLGCGGKHISYRYSIFFNVSA